MTVSSSKEMMSKRPLNFVKKFIEIIGKKVRKINLSRKMKIL
jgi:hypothetical protein